MFGKFQGPPANSVSLDRFLMANWAINWAYQALAEEKKNGTYFFAQTDLNFFLAKSHCRLLRKLGVYWPQSHRVTDIQVYSVFLVSEIFLCLISIKSPTSFADRGLTKHCIWPKYHLSSVTTNKTVLLGFLI